MDKRTAEILNDMIKNSHKMNDNIDLLIQPIKDIIKRIEKLEKEKEQEPPPPYVRYE